MLRGDPRLDGVTITTDLDPPTSDQMPYVAVRAAGWSDDPRYLTAGLGSAGAYDATVRFDIVCWVVSGQSTGDAVRQRNTWINTLRNVVLDNANLSGSFNWLVMVGGELDARNGLSKGGDDLPISVDPVSPAHCQKHPVRPRLDRQM